MIKTRKEIIYDMCFTTRHDFGIEKSESSIYSSGITKREREVLIQRMSELYDKCIFPYMKFRKK